jgi:transcriptional regulator with XRE-family HTH domain
MVKDPRNTNNEAISRRLRALREAYTPSQVEFCEMVGLKPPAWNNYEKGTNRISLDAALALAQKTGVSLDWIYYGDESGLPLRLASKLTTPPSAETA